VEVSSELFLLKGCKKRCEKIIQNSKDSNFKKDTNSDSINDAKSDAKEKVLKFIRISFTILFPNNARKKEEISVTINR